VERDDGLASLPGARPADSVPPPRLLGAFDPLLLGWTSRDDVLVDEPGRRLVTAQGLFRPFALVRGRAVATWSYAGKKVELSPFGPLPKTVARALAAEADDVVRFLG
jgi:hypothetical protein